MDTARQTHEPAYQRTLIELLCAYWKFVATVVVVFWLIAGAAAFLMTPVYEATIIVLPTPSVGALGAGNGVLGSFGGLGSILGLGTSQSQVAIEAEALLKSRVFTERFIREHGLMQKLFAKKWDAEHSRWRASRWPWSGPPRLYEAYRLFIDKVRSIDVNKKGLLTMRLDWTNSVDAAEWANEMIQEVNQRMRKRAIAHSEATINALNGELRSARTVEERNAIAQALVTYVKVLALAQARPDYAFTVVAPAIPSSKKDFIRPQRALYLAGGPVLGFLFALFALISWEYYARHKWVSQQAAQR